MDTFRKMEGVVEQYNRDLARWEQQVKEKEKPQRPPEKDSVRDRLSSYRQRANSKEHERSPKTKKDNFDTEHDTAGQNPCLAGLHREALFLHHFCKELGKEKDRQLQRCIHRAAAGYLSTQLLRLFAQSLTKLSCCAIINKQICLFIFERRSNLD